MVLTDKSRDETFKTIVSFILLLSGELMGHVLSTRGRNHKRTTVEEERVDMRSRVFAERFRFILCNI